MHAGGCGGSRRPQGSALRVVGATLVLLATTAVLSPAPGRADTGDPVLLVHGGLGSPADFRQMIDWLDSDGYRPYTVDLGLPGIDTAANAKKIGAKVDQIRAETGAPKVHLVGHSMGGLSARYYIKILGGLPQCLPATDRRRAAWRRTAQRRDLPSGQGRSQLHLPTQVANQPTRDHTVTTPP